MVFLVCCIYSVSYPTRGHFLEAVLQRTERELAAPGRLGTVDRLVAKGGAPGGAAPYVTGRARFPLPREVGTFLPPQGCPLVPWRLPPLHPLALVREGLANLGRFAPRECKLMFVPFRGARAASKSEIRPPCSAFQPLWIPDSRYAPGNDE